MTTQPSPATHADDWGDEDVAADHSSWRRPAAAGRAEPTAREAIGRPYLDLVQRSRPPALPREHLPRPALDRRLEDAGGSAVTSVVAPAGAGKTLGVAGWLRASGRTTSTLWATATSALGQGALRRLIAATEPGSETGQPGDAVLPRPAPDLLVIDDAEHLPAATIRSLDDLLNQQPETLHVVLLSRWDLPFSRLIPELLGNLTVLRGDVLRLDDEEATALARRHARTASPAVLQAITAHAQGWCAAVVLTARAVGAAPDPAVAAERLGRRGPAVADRMVTEVFSTLTERQRHLLLSLGGEQSVTVATAAHLSHDPLAGELLADLEATGLLVTRSGVSGTPVTSALADPEEPAGEDEPPIVFKIHPLLAEVTRRRLVVGGVDVARARGAVLRAVHLDLARGDIPPSFRRLVVYGEVGEAARVLAEHGLALQLSGHGAAIRRFARVHPTAIDENPETWFSVAYERWTAGDVNAAGHWMDRIAVSRRAAGEAPGVEAACIGLLRSRLGIESAPSAIERARRVVAEEQSSAASSPMLSVLLLELGITENWLGQLAQAEAHLSAAALAGRHEAISGFRAEALSHLVFTEYMLGREHVGVDLAEESLQILAAQPWQPATTTARVMVALELIQMQDLPWASAPLRPTVRQHPVHQADLATKFWAHVLTARRSLACGSVVEAEHVLDVPVEAPSLPRHLRIAALVERAMAAGLATDRDRLRRLAQDLGALDAPAEAAFVAGVLADLVGDQHRADELWRRTASPGAAAQPGIVPMALASRAQLIDAMGRHDEADRLMMAAALATEVTRYAVPFLGWSRSGTPMPVLLERLEAARPTSWVRDLAAASAAHPGLGAYFGPVTATVQERAHAAAPAVAPLLSPRERDVLHELARGSTYADIAANLIVSENTVKTHVSSLYSKLAVSRRSEALAVARTSHLL